MLQIAQLTKTYKLSGSRHIALDKVSFTIKPGESVGVLGASGAGKSTLARLLLGLERPDGGSILLDGQPVNFASVSDRHKYYRSVQMVFQDTPASFPPLRTIGQSIADSMKWLGYTPPDKSLYIKQLLRSAGLPEDTAGRYPAMLSGGQAQRAAIARAICCRPRFLICDEITSALDTIYQGQIIRLLENLRREGMSLLFITHSPALMRQICSRIIVLHRGQVIEEGPVEKVILHPRQQFTASLLSHAARFSLQRQVDRGKQ